MSLFGKVFSKNSKEKPPTPQEAIQRIRDVEDLLNKKSQFLDKKINDELQTAKQYGTKNKKMALQALKRKKRYEQQLVQLDGTLTTLEYQREILENANSNAQVLKVMTDASKAFKNVNKDLDVDKVHDLMDDMAEQNQLAQEISSAISNPVGFSDEVDEDELLRELQELQDTDVEKELLNIPSAPSHGLPQVSNKNKVNARKSEEDDELSKMAAWANS